MKTPHVTMAVPHGMRGGKQCPAEWGDPCGPGAPGCGSRGAARARARHALVWAIVASVLAASTVAFGQGFTSLVFGVDDKSDLWLMDLSGTTSGTATFRLSTPVTKGAANGLAYDRVRDQLFVADTSNSNLWWLGSGSTAFTSLGNISAYTTAIGRPGQPVSAAYYNNAYWFLGSGSVGNLLGKVSLSYPGGIPTVVSGTTYTITGMPTAASGGGDLVITGGTGAGSGRLYAYSSPGPGNFFTVDVTTASSGTVGGYGLISTTSGTGLQLALGDDGTTLYGTDRRTGNWYTVNTSNGSLTQIPGFQTLTGGTTGFTDLAGSAQGTPVVPEPSTYALALAGLACGGFSMWRRRTRR